MARTLDKKPGIMIYDPDVINDMLQDMDRESVGEAFIAFFKYVVDDEDPFDSILSAPVRMILRPLCKSKRKSDESYLKKAVDGRYYRYKQLCEEREKKYLTQEEWARTIDVIENPGDYIYSADAQIKEILEKNKTGLPRVPQESPGNVTQPSPDSYNETEPSQTEPSQTEWIPDEFDLPIPVYLGDEDGGKDEDKDEDRTEVNKVSIVAADVEIDNFLREQGTPEDEIPDFRENRLKPEMLKAINSGFDITKLTWKSWTRAKFFYEPRKQTGSNQISSVLARISYAIPSLDEVKAYCEGKGYHFSPERFCEKMEAAGWKDNYGERIRYWQDIADRWEAQEMRSQKNK